MNKENMIQSGYCSEEIHDFLVRCVKAHCTIVICGLPGAGQDRTFEISDPVHTVQGTSYYY